MRISMMRLSAYGSVVAMLAASSVLFAQGDAARAGSKTARVGSQNDTIVPDVRQIVESSIAATERHWKIRLRYSYLARDEDRRLDVEGHVRSADVEVSRTGLFNGVPFDQLVERNGRPPSVEEQRKEKEKLDKLRRETPEQRIARIRTEEEDKASLVREIPKAFDFQLVGEEAVNGRAAYVLQATPRPGYQPQGKYGKMFAKVAGRLWVDKQDLGWIKADGQVIQPFSMGLFLERMLSGSRNTTGQTRVDDGIWMPEHIEVRAAAKIFFVKSLVIERVVTYSEYALPYGSVISRGDPAIQ